MDSDNEGEDSYEFEKDDGKKQKKKKVEKNADFDDEISADYGEENQN